MTDIEDKIWNMDEHRELTKEERVKLSKYKRLRWPDYDRTSNGQESYRFDIYEHNGSRIFVPRSAGGLMAWAKFRKQMGLPI